MEEVGTQVATPPVFIYNALGAGRFCDTHTHTMPKKRSLPFQGPNFTQHQHQHQYQQQQQHSSFIPGLDNPINSWNPNNWEWDSSRFLAKPVDMVEVPREQQQQRQQLPVPADSNASRNLVGGKEDERLLLKLGGTGGDGLAPGEDSVTRPNKRVRSGSPGTGGAGNGNGNFPMCQVDNCKEDLSTAKDYHRRHKVCEVHSKAGKALVGKQMQRFCQQCSRFHPLSEFDEGKRSCRRRLAGHNRRRRKTQPEDISSQLLVPGSGNHDKNGNGDMDIVNLLTVLACAQGNAEDRSNKDQLIQILNKIHSLPLPADLASKLPVSGNLSRIEQEKVSSENHNKFNGNTASSTMDLLAVLSDTLAAPSLDPQSRNQGNGTDKYNSGCSDQAAFLNLRNQQAAELPSRGERSSTSFQSRGEDSECQVLDAPNLPLQLFSSSPEDGSPPNLASSRKYFSSDSSNPMEDRSPSSSPVVQRLFPTRASREAVKPESLSTSGEVTVNVQVSRAHGGAMSLELFGGSNRRADNVSIHSSPYRPGYTSSSGSDQSPSSLNSDPQDRTGRILFKLFDKDPSHLPSSLRTQIYSWLAHCPSEMEGYIRPGCVVLSIYISMPASAWDQLEGNFLQYINSLLQDSRTNFCGNGRFLVHTNKHLASHKDGKVHLCKSWRAWNSPQLISISPLAVIAGKETSLLIRGRNLRMSGTRIYCTHANGYALKEVSGSADQESSYEEITTCNFSVSAPSVLGRCFIEIENGFRGTSFPIIIANATLCQELRLLEAEFDKVVTGQSSSAEEIMHFLNELGWLFQKKGDSPKYSIGRFKFLLVFSVERDFCGLVKTLLDILLRNSLGDEESLEMLSGINLLNRAVKKKCKSMVDMLLNYSVAGNENSSRKYIFPPNLVGPGGITPLHLAACTSDSDDIVDALTNDPQEIGVLCWSSSLDANGLSPFGYACLRNNQSYNSLVARKIVDRIAGQVSVSISNEIELQTMAKNQDQQQLSFRVMEGANARSCSRCAVIASKHPRRIPGSQGLLHRPYMHSMLAIAAVCVCVCLFLRGAPDIGSVAPFKWENLDFGSM